MGMVSVFYIPEIYIRHSLDCSRNNKTKGENGSGIGPEKQKKNDKQIVANEYIFSEESCQIYTESSQNIECWWLPSTCTFNIRNTVTIISYSFHIWTPGAYYGENQFSEFCIVMNQSNYMPPLLRCCCE